MFSFVPLSQGLWGWAKNTPGPGGGGQALVAGHGPVLADDQVALPVPRYHPVVDGRALVDQPHAHHRLLAPADGGPLARPTP